MNICINIVIRTIAMPAFMAGATILRAKTVALADFKKCIISLVPCASLLHCREVSFMQLMIVSLVVCIGHSFHRGIR